jgi:5-methylcytosine-specific restriction endonuclease McrA
MSTNISFLRSRAFTRQSGRCFYCAVPMWLGSPEQFALKYRIAVTKAMRFQCTAEHLIPLQNGGVTSQENIVAACRFCNQNRHRRRIAPCPDRYKSLVTKRVSLQRWHPSWTFENGMVAT